jgi:SAM-dependent methyltransferase
MRKVLNVGGNNKDIGLPDHFSGWRQDLLDIDPRGKPDLVGDARRLADVAAARTYDAVFCSHNLEHYYPHEASKVLQGFSHVLDDDGFVEILVPDIGRLIEVVAAQQLDLTDTLYETPGGPITAIDMIYGWTKQIAESGEDFFAHKNGFSQKSLSALLENHFPISVVMARPQQCELRALAFKREPARQLLVRLGVPVAT